jgi:hypothetical protein
VATDRVAGGAQDVPHGPAGRDGGGLDAGAPRRGLGSVGDQNLTAGQVGQELGVRSRTCAAAGRDETPAGADAGGIEMALTGDQPKDHALESRPRDVLAIGRGGQPGQNPLGAGTVGLALAVEERGEDQTGVAGGAERQLGRSVVVYAEDAGELVGDVCRVQCRDERKVAVGKRRLYEALAASVSRSEHRVLEDARHSTITTDCPDTVTLAVHDVWQRVC